MRPPALLLAAALVFAGCLGGPASTDATPTDATPDTAPDRSVTPYPNRTVSFPDGPEERPERPATLDRSTASEFVRTFEYRRAYNRLWYGEHSEVHLDCEGREVTERADGYRVVVRCSGYSNTGGDAAGNGTATVVHADWETQTFAYYVDGNTLVRERVGWG